PVSPWAGTCAGSTPGARAAATPSPAPAAAGGPPGWRPAEPTGACHDRAGAGRASRYGRRGRRTALDSQHGGRRRLAGAGGRRHRSGPVRHRTGPALAATAELTGGRGGRPWGDGRPRGGAVTAAAGLGGSPPAP